MLGPRTHPHFFLHGRANARAPPSTSPKIASSVRSATNGGGLPDGQMAHVARKPFAFSNKLAPPFSAKTKKKPSARLSSPPRRSSRHPTRRYLRRRRRPRPPFPSLLPSPPALRRAGRVRLRPRQRAVAAASAPSTRNPRCLFPAAAGCGVPPLPLFLSLSLSLLGCQRCSRPRPRQLPCVARVHVP